MIGKEIIDLIRNYSTPDILSAGVLTLLIGLAGSTVFSFIKSFVGAAVSGLGGIKGQEHIQAVVADVEADGAQKPLSAQGRANIRRYCSRYLARKSTGRYVPVLFEQLAVLVACLIAATIVFGASSLYLEWPFIGLVLMSLGALLGISAIVPFALLVTNSANIPEMRSKWKAIGVRREVKKALEKTEDPDWSYIVGPLARKTVRMLVESSDRWCLVRADSERGALGVRLTGSVESADLPDAEEDVLYLVYSDYGLNSAKMVQELLGRGYRAYNIGVVFDEQVLWQRLAIELDLLEQSGLVPPRVGGARP